MTEPLEPQRTSEPALFPERLGRYELLLPIASGGMATVYLARAVGAGGFERDVALKLTHFHLREDPDFVASLMDEARLAGRINHPNVVSVLDVGEDPHGVFIVMEYVEGDSLAALQRSLKRRGEKVPVPLALRLMDDLLAGLHAAHELTDDAGALLYLIHRDVTPHNVLLGIDGVTKLADFGIAKAAARLGNTATGLVKGKVAYMAPEQAQGHGIDRRVDVWAAGVVAWEILTGTRLYQGSADAAILLKIVREPPLGVRTVNPEVPAAIEAAVTKALSLDVAARFPTAEAFAEALALAARAAGVARAERKQVIQFLKPLLDERLAERRARAREVRALRQRVGELAHLERVSRPAFAAVTPAAASSQAEDLATATVVSGPPTATLAGFDGGPNTDHTQTGTAGISTMARSILPPRRGRVLLLAAAATSLALAGLLALAASRDDATDGPASSAPSSGSAAPTSALPPAHSEAATSAPLASAGPMAAPSASADKPKPSRTLPRGTPHPAGPSTTPRPLDNPYAKKP